MRTTPAIVAAFTVAASCARPAPAQAACSDQGCILVPRQVTASPLPLGCHHPTSWPMWHLVTPAHRAPAPHAGFDPGDANALGVQLLAWRCTGLAFAPVVVDHVVRMGYVIDRGEHPCVRS